MYATLPYCTVSQSLQENYTEYMLKKHFFFTRKPIDLDPAQNDKQLQNEIYAISCYDGRQLPENHVEIIHEYLMKCHT